MYDKLYVSRKVSDLVEGLKEIYGLTTYEALDIALKIERNEILERAFVITDSNSEPTALEKLVITIQEK